MKRPGTIPLTKPSPGADPQASTGIVAVSKNQKSWAQSWGFGCGGVATVGEVGGVGGWYGLPLLAVHSFARCSSGRRAIGYNF